MRNMKKGNFKNDPQVSSLHSRMRGAGLAGRRMVWEVSPELHFRHVEFEGTVGHSSGHV